MENDSARNALAADGLKAKKFVLSIYDDADFDYMGNKILHPIHAWTNGTSFVSRVNLNYAYDFLSLGMYSENEAWILAQQQIEKRMLEKLES